MLPYYKQCKEAAKLIKREKKSHFGGLPSKLH